MTITIEVKEESNLDIKSCSSSILNYVEKNTSIDRLKDLKYNSVYTDEQMHFYSAKDIPKFKEQTPAGVSKAEYDCSLEHAVPLNVLDFINSAKTNLSKEIF